MKSDISHQLTVLPIAPEEELPSIVPTTITLALDRPFKIVRLEIEDTDTTRTSDWIVNAIRIDGASMLEMSGDLPGDVFATNAIDTFIRFPPGSCIELVVTYLGFNEDGCRFSARLLGTVVHDSLDEPPSDVHATIQISQGKPTRSGLRSQGHC